MEVKFRGRLERGKEGPVRILNRIVTSTRDGIEYEADQRHAKIIVREAGLEESSREVVTPGINEGEDCSEEGEVDEKLYRALAARGNYLGQDRVDIQFAAKEVSRFMSTPEPSNGKKVKRVARYLKGSRRCVHVFKNQEMPEWVVVWSDSDFAICRRTRKSTSGGVIMLGDHCIKTYSLTQESTALAVGEAEFYGIVKARSYGIGVVSLLKDLGVDVKRQVNKDSYTEKSIATRRGAGKVRHLDTREMWIQEKVLKCQVTLKKVPGTENLADILTKHVSRADLDRHMKKIDIERRDGRHPLSPSIQGGHGGEKGSKKK